MEIVAVVPAAEEHSRNVAVAKQADPSLDGQLTHTLMGRQKQPVTFIGVLGAAPVTACHLHNAPGPIILHQNETAC